MAIVSPHETRMDFDRSLLDRQLQTGAAQRSTRLRRDLGPILCGSRSPNVDGRSLLLPAGSALQPEDRGNQPLCRRRACRQLPASNSPMEGTVACGRFHLVDSQAQKSAVDINGPLSLVRAVIGAAVRALGTLRGTLMDRAIMVEIPAERDPLGFAITPVIARHLFERGRRATIQFLEEVEAADALGHFHRPAALGETDHPPRPPPSGDLRRPTLARSRR